MEAWTDASHLGGEEVVAGFAGPTINLVPSHGDVEGCQRGQPIRFLLTAPLQGGAITDGSIGGAKRLSDRTGLSIDGCCSGDSSGSPRR